MAIQTGEPVPVRAAAQARPRLGSAPQESWIPESTEEVRENPSTNWNSPL